MKDKDIIEELKIAVLSLRDGGINQYTLNQLFNDFDLGSLVASGRGFSLEKHKKALSWLKNHTKEFIEQALKAQKEEIKEMLERVQWNGDHMWELGCACHACKKNTEIENIIKKI